MKICCNLSCLRCDVHAHRKLSQPNSPGELSCTCLKQWLQQAPDSSGCSCCIQKKKKKKKATTKKQTKKTLRCSCFISIIYGTVGHMTLSQVRLEKLDIVQADEMKDIARFVLYWLVGCLMSQQHSSVSQGLMCSDNCTCCNTEIEAADKLFYLTQ